VLDWYETTNIFYDIYNQTTEYLLNIQATQCYERNEIHDSSCTVHYKSLNMTDRKNMYSLKQPGNEPSQYSYSNCVQQQCVNQTGLMLGLKVPRVEGCDDTMPSSHDSLLSTRPNTMAEHTHLTGSHWSKVHRHSKPRICLQHLPCSVRHNAIKYNSNQAESALLYAQYATLDELLHTPLNLAD